MTFVYRDVWLGMQLLKTFFKLLTKLSMMNIALWHMEFPVKTYLKAIFIWIYIGKVISRKEIERMDWSVFLGQLLAQHRVPEACSNIAVEEKSTLQVCLLVSLKLLSRYIDWASDLRFWLALCILKSTCHSPTNTNQSPHLWSTTVAGTEHRSAPRVAVILGYVPK